MIERNLSHLALSDSGFLFDSSTGHTYTLNNTGAFIMKHILNKTEVDQILEKLLGTYDIDKQVASGDIDQFLHYLTGFGFLDKSELKLCDH